MPERHGERVNDVHVDERGENAGEDEQERMLALDAQREIADRGDDRLQESDRDEQQPTAHIALAWRVHADLLIAVHFKLVDRDEHESADPQRKIRVERRDRGTIVFDRVEDLFVQMHRLAHERADLARVKSERLGKLLEHRRTAQRGHIGARGVELFGEIGELCLRASNGGVRLGHGARQLVEQPVALFQRALQRGKRAGQRPIGQAECIEPGVEIRHDRAGDGRVCARHRRRAVLRQRGDIVVEPVRGVLPRVDRSRGVLIEGVDALLLERQLFAGFGELRGKILIRLAVRIQLAGLQRLLHAVEHIAGGGVDVMHGAGHLVERVLRGVQSAEHGAGGIAHVDLQAGQLRAAVVERSDQRVRESFGLCARFAQQVGRLADGVKRVGDFRGERDVGLFGRIDGGEGLVERGAGVAQLLLDGFELVDGVGQIVDDVALRAFHAAGGFSRCLLHFLCHGVGHAGNESGVDLLVDRGRARIGDFRRDRVQLFVDVVRDRRSVAFTGDGAD